MEVQHVNSEQVMLFIFTTFWFVEFKYIVRLGCGDLVNLTNGIKTRKYIN